MYVWYHLSTIFNQRRVLRIVGILTLCVAFITMLFFSAVAQAAPGINKTISFQGRLLTSGGTPVPNGFYNIQFKIYEGGSGTAVGNPDGTLKWTETYTNNGAQTGIKVTNGYMSVNLGTNTPFGSSIDWNQDSIWLSMNIAGLTTGCSTFNTGLCIADGEMTPMKRLTATPYALNAGMLGGLTADRFLQLDAEEHTGSFSLTGTARANTLQGTSSVISPMFDSANYETAVSIGSTNAGTVNVGTMNNNQTINLGTGNGNKIVTIGSTVGQSYTNVQGGTLGVGVHTSGGFVVRINQTEVDSLALKSDGNIDLNLADSANLRIARASDDHAIFSVKSNGEIKTSYDSSLTVTGNASFEKGINIQGTTTYLTPGGYTMSTAIGIPNYAVPDYSSVFAFGLPASSSASARGLIVADARTSNHQATIGVLSPDENNIMGLSWNGSNTTGYITNTANSLAFQGGGLNLLTATNNGGNAQVGIGNDGSAGHALDVTGDINASSNFSLGGVSILDSSNLKFNGATMAKIEAGSGQGLQLAADGGVKIGDSTATGQPTLLTLDSSTGTPTATGSTILGSMYYDTTLGKVQCYEADGWGSCSSSPDTYVSLDPQYANSVVGGSSSGSLDAVFCSDALNINDGSSGQPQYCNANETRNLYNWSTAEPVTQTKNIFVTYQLPSNFKKFASGTTSLMAARSASAVAEYQIYKSNASGLTACGTVTTATAVSTWQKLNAVGSADPANCSFAAGDSIVFKINLGASTDELAGVSTLGFAFSND